LKVDVLAGAVASINPAVTVTSIAQSVLQVEVARRLRDVDAIFCCTDTHGSRAVLNQLAYQYYLPVFDAGVRIDSRDGIVTRVGGRAQLLAPGLGCLSCSGLLDFAQVRRDLQSDDERAHDPYIVGHREPQPSVVSLNGTVASLAVTMFLATFVGFPGTARYQVYRLESGTVRAVAAPRDPACIVCSSCGVLGRGDLVPLIGRTG
jgi:molybdopterin-synthase adenylyltransferase